MAMMTKFEISRELKQLAEKEANLRGSLKLLENPTPTEELAVEFHRLKCRRGEGCTFRYETTWKATEHRKWLEKADLALKFASAENILNILWVVKD